MHNIHQNVDNADKAAQAVGLSMANERHQQLVALMRPQLPQPFQLTVNCKVLKYPRSPIFQGRLELLQIMDEHLKPYPDSPNLRTFVIYGMGGVAYPAIFWVSAARQEKLFQDFQTISQYLGFESHQVSDQWRVRDEVLVWMKQNGSWLLVFDNVDDAALLQEFLPAADSGGAVLMTSRNSSLVPGIARNGLEVEPFSDEESAKLLLCILGKPAVGTDFDIATKIGQELAGLPLAISQMAGFIQQTRCPLEEFLLLYRSSDNYQKIQSQSTLVDRLHYHLTLQNVWEMSFSRLDDSSKAVLDVFALLDPDGIPEKLLRDSIGMPDLKFLDSNLESVLHCSCHPISLR
ncbi:hypothetical protein BFW01_g5724 [Lasiodiplodia theobromae]|nr:hypothetical protein BFW01_g5724 [Lasiodiplodia theobromae]